MAQLPKPKQMNLEGFVAANKDSNSPNMRLVAGTGPSKSK